MTKPARYRKGGLFCTWCSKPLSETDKGQYCSETCKHESLMRTSHSYARDKIFERDGGVCELCGMDTDAEAGRLIVLAKEDPEQYLAEREHLGIPPHRRTLWDMDHIYPVVEGGGQCGLEGLRTLCLWCHNDTTAGLNSRIARAKRSMKSGASGNEGFAAVCPIEQGPSQKGSLLSGDQNLRSPGISVIHMLRKPLSEPTLAENTLKWGCGGINVDATRLFCGTEHMKGYIPPANLDGDRHSFDASRRGGMTSHGFQATDHPGGRWPANLVLQHLPGCRREGTRRIWASPLAKGPSKSTLNCYGGYDRRSQANHADPDGKETIPNWICVPGCPCADLDAQSGVSRARIGKPRKGAHGRGWGSTHTGQEYNDKGGASRYFRQVGGKDDGQGT